MREPYRVILHSSNPNGTYRSIREQFGVKQKPFEPVPLSYKAYFARQTSYEGVGLWADGNHHSGCNSSNFFPTHPLSRPECTIAINKAREKFLSSVGGNSELGTTIVEWHSSLEMITTRAGALAKGYKHLRKGELKAFLGTFNIRPKPKHRRQTWSRPKDASALWIEYWFGWAPAVGDIYDSIEVLQNPVADKDVEAASGRDITIYDDKSSAATRWVTDCNGFVIAKFGGKVAIANPNLYQANQLGLVNPAAIAWNIVPFSWLVDWFANVGQFLEGFTDTLGLSFKDLYLTRFGQLKSHHVYIGNLPHPDVMFGVVEDAEMTQMERITLQTLPMPRLTATLPLRLSVTRAATAVSLLTLLFTSEKKI